MSMLTPLEMLALGLIGLFAGAAGGLLGVGGSIVMIPAMTEVLGPDQHLYQAAAMIVNFFVVVPAVYQHSRAKAVRRRIVLRLLPLTIVGVMAGVGISELGIFAGPREAYLRMIFGLFLLGVVCIDLCRLFTPRAGGDALAAPGAGKQGWTFCSLVALPTGLVAGLLGVGGGVVAVPLQRRLLGVPIRNAIANSATIIIATSFIGAWLKNYAYAVEHPGSSRPIALAACLIPTAIIGSLIGSRMTHVLPVRWVKIAFLILLLVAAIRMAWAGVESAGGIAPI